MFVDALVAEQVDAADLKSVARKGVPVRFRPSAPLRKPPFLAVFLFFKSNFILTLKCKYPHIRIKYLAYRVRMKIQLFNRYSMRQKPNSSVVAVGFIRQILLKICSICYSIWIMNSLVVGIIFFFILYAIYKIWYDSVIEKQNLELLKQNAELLASITDPYRGNSAEKDLILTLLKLGIHPKAIFHDLYILKDDGKYVQIDLVVATRVGIIVFEVKDYSGWIYGKGNQAKWTQVLAYGEEKYRFYNPIMQNNTHIKQLRKRLKENIPFYSVIVFYGDSELQDISFIPKGTFITKWYRVADVVNTIMQENPVANYKNKHLVVKILKEAVTRGNEQEIETRHIENIKDMLGTDRIFQ